MVSVSGIDGNCDDDDRFADSEYDDGDDDASYESDDDDDYNDDVGVDGDGVDHDGGVDDCIDGGFYGGDDGDSGHDDRNGVDEDYVYFVLLNSIYAEQLV